MRKSNNNSKRQHKLRAKEVKARKLEAVKQNCTRKPTAEELRRERMKKARGSYPAFATGFPPMDIMEQMLERSEKRRLLGPIEILMEDIQTLDAAKVNLRKTVRREIEALDVAKAALKQAPYIIRGGDY